MGLGGGDGGLGWVREMEGGVGWGRCWVGKWRVGLGGVGWARWRVGLGLGGRDGEWGVGGGRWRVGRGEMEVGDGGGGEGEMEGVCIPLLFRSSRTICGSRQTARTAIT